MLEISYVTVRYDICSGIDDTINFNPNRNTTFSSITRVDGFKFFNVLPNKILVESCPVFAQKGHVALNENEVLGLLVVGKVSADFVTVAFIKV